jgi:hypothetical protein
MEHVPDLHSRIRYEEPRKDPFEDFAAEANRQLSILERDDLREVETRVVQLPSGDELTVSQFSRRAEHDDITEETVFLARDHSGLLVGYRLTQTKEPEYLNEARATGYTRIAVGGQGIATVLEMINQEYLQHLANTLQEPLVQVVSNANEEDLRRLRDSGAAEDVIAKKELEQKRWQSLYGPGGKLGFDERGKRTFTPHASRTS